MQKFFSFSVLLSISIILLFISSCEKVIDININNADPKIVVEGLITDTGSIQQHSILLSKTSDFNSSNARIPVVGALVVVTDQTANTIDTLNELLPGEYVTQSIKGVPGHTYELWAKVGEEIFTAKSTMPFAVAYDSLYTKPFSFFGQTTDQYFPVFTDPIGVENFYLFYFKVNDSLDNSFNAWDDLLSDGKTNSRPLFIDNLTTKEKGTDTVTLFMNCTDRAVYNFYNTLGNATGNGQTPANPLSNISNGALGFFGAITVRSQTIILMK